MSSQCDKINRKQKWSFWEKQRNQNVRWNKSWTVLAVIISLSQWNELPNYKRHVGTMMILNYWYIWGGDGSFIKRIFIVKLKNIFSTFNRLSVEREVWKGQWCKPSWPGIHNRLSLKSCSEIQLNGKLCMGMLCILILFSRFFNFCCRKINSFELLFKLSSPIECLWFGGSFSTE